PRQQTRSLRCARRLATLARGLCCGPPRERGFGTLKTRSRGNPACNSGFVSALDGLMGADTKSELHARPPRSLNLGVATQPIRGRAAAKTPERALRVFEHASEGFCWRGLPRATLLRFLRILLDRQVQRSVAALYQQHCGVVALAEGVLQLFRRDDL